MSLDSEHARGGRPKGSKGHRNDGLQKRCACARRRWSECSHPWFFNFKYGGVDFRFNLNREADKPRNKPLSKTDAEALRDRYRGQIREGSFRNGQQSARSPSLALTLGDVADQYGTKYIRQPTRRASSQRGMEWYMQAIRRADVPAANGAMVRLESKPLDAITKADVEAVRDQWRGRRHGSKGGSVGTNRMLTRFKHFCTWCVAEGFTEHNPFKRHGITIVKHDRRAEQPRTRRLLPDVLDKNGRVKTPGEEARLLQHAGPHLHALIIAALETGCRLGELLTVQWRDVRTEQNVLLLHADNTKTAESRDVPISQRLKAVLEMRRTGPDGKELPLTAYVFGNEVGQRAKSIRQAWRNTCRRAGITDLHFHDLRREFGSRLLESGAAPHVVRDWLGHADITTTSRYLSTTRVGLQHALKRFEQHRSNRLDLEKQAPPTIQPSAQ